MNGLPFTLLVPLALSAPAALPEKDWAVTGLRCEYLETPLGIDELRPRLSWRLRSSRRGEGQSAYRILVATTPEKLEPGEADMWDSGKVSDRSTQIPYAGKPLQSGAGYYWRVEAWNGDGSASAHTESSWEMGLLQPGDWRGFWIGSGSESARPTSSAPSPYLRKAFNLDRDVLRARLYVTALGCYELHLNGRRVGDAYFAPGWTDYDQRIQYQTYDVTALLRRGGNALGAVLGDGWYAGSIGMKAERYHYGPYPLGLRAQLRIDYADGSQDAIVSDASWKASTGPILASDFLMGETYDARLEMPGWSESGFDDSSWKPVSVLPPPGAALVAEPSPPVKRTGEVPTRAVSEPRPGVYVFDLGQNMVGWARLRVSGEPGTRVQLRFAEMLQPDGSIYTENYRLARSTDVYVLKGGGLEAFEPHFTFRGFRYVEVTGYPGKPSPDSVAGIVLHSATPPTGTFETSSELLNRLQSNIVWSQRGNFLSVPTDCPQRDERLGWMGDAQIFARTACFNMDVAAFFTKWMQDVEDAQSKEGGFPDVAPRLVVTTDGAPGWGDAGILVPWAMYECYGDQRILERHYRAMQKWMTYIHRANPDGIRKSRLNNNYGDWIALGPEAPKELLATTFYAHDADIMARMATVLGYSDDATYYRSLFDRVKRAFNEAFVNAEARIAGDTQTAYALAIRFNLLREEEREAAGRHLVEAVERRSGHLATGFLGIRDLLPALADSGHLDVAYRLLTQDTFPSWGYAIRNGATTIWERWDGWTQEKGFQDPGMNSFNHYSLGSVGEWLYEYVAGIGFDPERPGYKHIIIHPRPGGSLTRVEATFASVHGPIRSSWRRDGARFELEVEIPTNTEAVVHVPGAAQPISVGSGKYRFQSEIQQER